MQSIHSPSAPDAIGPYSQAVLAGGFVYVSGQLPLNKATGVLETDPARAAAQALRNIGAILEAAGLSLADVVRVGIYLTDMEHFAAVNEAYAGFFHEPYPARACVEVSALPKGAVLEIEAVAAAHRQSG